MYSRVTKEPPPFLTYLWALDNSSRDVSSTLPSFTTLLLMGEKETHRAKPKICRRLSESFVASVPLAHASATPVSPRCPSLPRQSPVACPPGAPCVIPTAGRVLPLNP